VPSLVNVPPVLVSAVAKVTPLPLVSTEYCWSAAVLNWAEKSCVMPVPYCSVPPEKVMVPLPSAEAFPAWKIVPLVSVVPPD
jgi:hypothetical protein